MFLSTVTTTLTRWIILGTVILKFHLKQLSVTLVVRVGVLSDAMISFLSNFDVSLWLLCGDGGIKFSVWLIFWLGGSVIFIGGFNKSYSTND